MGDQFNDPFSQFAWHESWSGDGFDATYSVAAAMAQGTLRCTRGNATSKAPCVGAGGARPLLAPSSVNLPRADLVVHGGDLSYPFPRAPILRDRFLFPLEQAFPAAPASAEGEEQGAEAPLLLVLPGNHEWQVRSP